MAPWIPYAPLLRNSFVKVLLHHSKDWAGPLAQAICSPRTGPRSGATKGLNWGPNTYYFTGLRIKAPIGVWLTLQYAKRMSITHFIWWKKSKLNGCIPWQRIYVFGIVCLPFCQVPFCLTRLWRSLGFKTAQLSKVNINFSLSSDIVKLLNH